MNQTKKGYFYQLTHYKSLKPKEKKIVYNITVVSISLIIIIPIMIAHVVLMFANNGKMGTPLWFEWFVFVMSTIVVILSGWSYFKTSYKEIFKWHRPGMSTLVAVACLVSYFYSFYPLIANTIDYAHHVKDHELLDFFDSAAMIVSIIKIGDTISDKLKLRTNDDLEAVASLQVEDALLYNPENDSTTEISTKDIKVGDLLLVKKGSRVPIDGVVYSGESDVDESMITGESKPIHKKVSEKVIGSTNNLTSTFVMQATSIGKNTVVNTIINNVKKISSQKPSYQKIADKVAMWFTPTVIALAILAFILQATIDNMANIPGAFNTWFHGDMYDMDKWTRAVYYAVSTLSIACPCALGLAVPLSTLVGASKAAKNGIIINTAEAYEKIKKIDAIAFDKTGTLTEGKFVVTNVLGDLDNLVYINQLEKKSIHPLATSFNEFIINKYPELAEKSLLDIDKIQEVPGIGMKCEDAKLYEVTSFSYVKKQGYEVAKELQSFVENYEKQENVDVMQSLVCLSIDKKVVNIVVFEDKIKDNAYDVINILKSKGIDVYMISGDNEIAVKFVANKLGIKNYYFNVKPDEKSSIIKQIQDQNKVVAYVGDGINDLEALKQSDLSIAVNKENSIANAISDVLILNNDILSILKTIVITQVTRKMIIFNLIWAFVYNVILIPLAIVGFIPAFIGIFAMALSSISVVGNSLIFKARKIRYISKNEQKNLVNKNISAYL